MNMRNDRYSIQTLAGIQTDTTNQLNFAKQAADATINGARVVDTQTGLVVYITHWDDEPFSD